MTKTKMKTGKKKPIRIGHEPIHTHFGLSYATHLVLPRSVLQSMPIGWQKKFVYLLEELDDCFSLDKLLPGDSVYEVSVVRYEELPAPGTDSTEYKLQRLCEKTNPPTWYTYDESREQYYEVTSLHDPLLHYDRGRRMIEPTDAKAFLRLSKKYVDSK